MAQVTLTFPVFNGGGDDHVGDTGGTSGGFNVFLPKAAVMRVGRPAKNGDEVNAFLAFDTTTVPLGDRIDGFNIEIVLSVDSISAGPMKIGFISPNASTAQGSPALPTWLTNGFAREADRSSGPFYGLAYKFPNDGTALPHASQDSSLTVESGILVLDGYSTGDIAWSTASWNPEVTKSFGDGIGGESQVEAVLLDIYTLLRNLVDKPLIALTLDAQNVPNIQAEIGFYSTDEGTEARRPQVVVKYSENFPAFTSSPVTTGDVSCGYVYTAVADPYDTFGDQTAGAFTSVVYSLEVFPTGMTIVTGGRGAGLITWTPSLAQEGAVHNVTVRATNPGGHTVDQLYTVTIPTVATPSIDSTPPAAFRVVLAYQATATNAVEACQDDALVWSLTTFPPGMTIGSATGLLEWIPTPGQVGLSHPVTIHVENFAPKSDDQSFNVLVKPKLEGEVIANPVDGLGVSAVPELHGTSAEVEPHGTSATVEPHDVTAETQGGPLSATFIAPAVVAEED